MKKIVSLILISFFVMAGCEEDYEHLPTAKDSVAPKQIENLQYEPIHGGFNISYDIPSDKDVLYVKATYVNTKGETSEVRASAYNNKLQILGFGDTSERTIDVYVVDRSENVSKPVTFKAQPLESPVNVIKESMDISADFGGAKFHWINELKTPISILLFTADNKGVWKEVQTVYTSQSETSTAIRGFESVPTKFAALIRDRYDNTTDTIYPGTTDKMLTPLFEERLDKTKFKKIVLADDTNWDAWEGDYYHFFDDKLETIVHTQGDHPFPQIYTIDLGVTVKLSRFIVHQRYTPQTHFGFTHGNPKKYTLYGAKELPADSGGFEGWIKLKECESVKPSGLPIGQNSDEDIAQLDLGDEYTFELEVPELRYFRMAVEDTWDGAGYINASQITFWGNITN
ncbi:hypothetical protein KCTC52924_00127 [Arenibacter antarcticus]|uniref:DUF5000 domain-containing lipoprotein n=1 Tax=Arenibacter antarcticus TaxID=2040469 RepID=A0ABW5VLD7_9FLAO|nr:DUF5000 domain-containing lipoprotein [Arenibacter sp. H213]